MPVFWFTLRVIAYASVLLVLYAAGRLGLEWWRACRERRQELARAWEDFDTRCAQLQSDLLSAYEENRQWIVVRPADRSRERHHPLGHRTESMLMLPEVEWKLWLSVMQEQIR